MERLHPRVRTLWLLGGVVPAVVLGAIAAAIGRFVLDFGLWVGPVVGVVVLVPTVAFVFLRYRVWRYDVQEDALYIERGVLTRVRTVVPFIRLQHVDTQRSPLERLTGLASVVVYTAGSRGADVTVPGLREADAVDLQERLRRLAIESELEDAV